jgi:urea carboxylase
LPKLYWNKGGFNVPEYLGSLATFTLGQFGGHAGRNLLIGDMLPIFASEQTESISLNPEQIPTFQTNWEIAVMYGPHGAPDFFTKNDISMFLSKNGKSISTQVVQVFA